MSLGELSRRSHYDKGYLSKVVNGRKAPAGPLARGPAALLGAGGALAVVRPAPRPREQPGRTRDRSAMEGAGRAIAEKGEPKPLDGWVADIFWYGTPYQG